MSHCGLKTFMLTRNFVKEKISKGLPVIGTWNTLGAPLVTDVLAQANFDFVLIDFEHGPFQLDRVHEYAARCELNACSPIVRLPTNTPWVALQALDQGAHGVMIPNAVGLKDAATLIESVKYPPLGRRGFTPFSRAGGFQSDSSGTHTSRANDLTLTAAIVESREGLERIDELLCAEELDVIYYGAYDLSQALGVPGQPQHPEVVRTIRAAAAKTLKAGKCPGGFVAHSIDDIRRQREMGLRFITYGVDNALLFKACREATTWFASGRNQ